MATSHHGTAQQKVAQVKAIVGLGNPGRQYADTRHNVGWMAIDLLARRIGAQWQAKFNGEYARGRLGDHDLHLLKPGTFMNLSGHPTQAMCQFFGVHVDELLVLHDEIDLPFGTVRLKSGGGHGGHNGLRSLIAQCGGNGFGRVRIGVGRPADGRVDTADWVLSIFSAIERAELPDMLERAVVAVEKSVGVGIPAAMNACNGPQVPKSGK